MKKIIYLFLSLTLLIIVSSCKDQLNTEPTTAVGSETIFKTAENAMTAVNGIYRGMYVAEWGPGWTHENGGIMAYITASDLMGEDHIQNKAGSGWFYYDYTYGITSDYTTSSGRQAQCWNFFYTLICNANNIIVNEKNIQNNPNLAKYVIGQAYAIRAYCYLWLVQSFQQCDPSLPGVPLYTEPTTIDSKGKGRGTVQQVYDRINEDLKLAIDNLSKTNVVQQHSSHIDQYVAQGIRARAALVQKDYPTAIIAAKEAMKKPSKKILSFTETTKVNDVSKANVMWGLAIQSDQAMSVEGIYTHIDADANSTYANKQQHLISSWLYDQMPKTDARRAWWTAPLPEKDWVDKTSKKSYVQVKMVFKDKTLKTGDYILMRVEEMALIVAEAACHIKDYTTAREYVKMVTMNRDINYEENLRKYSDGFDYNSETSSTINNLMDYILFQRRIELWGEVSRIHDIKRLDLGMNRDYTYTPNNHTKIRSYKPKYKFFIYAIPQKEFDGNSSLDPVNDQNPL
ncbi:MAG: RagB/SusD family nutrient uptake outer membrane protein [Bacteroidales bacterium]